MSWWPLCKAIPSFLRIRIQGSLLQGVSSADEFPGPVNLNCVLLLRPVFAKLEQDCPTLDQYVSGHITLETLFETFVMYECLCAEESQPNAPSGNFTYHQV
jgi:hypothetical protein